MMKKADTTEIHELTRAVIAKQVTALNARRSQIVSQRASWYANAVKQGFDSSTPMVDADERAAREHAKHLLNGNAPESLSLPPAISLDKQLAREQRGIDIAIKVLLDKDLVARTTEAVIWGEENNVVWRNIAGEIVLAMLRLEALKLRAQELLDTCPDIMAIKLPVWLVGHHLEPVHPSVVPLNELRSMALAEGVITQAQIRKTENVE